MFGRKARERREAYERKLELIERYLVEHELPKYDTAQVSAICRGIEALTWIAENCPPAVEVTGGTNE